MFPVGHFNATANSHLNPVPAAAHPSDTEMQTEALAQEALQCLSDNDQEMKDKKISKRSITESESTEKKSDLRVTKVQRRLQNQIGGEAEEKLAELTELENPKIKGLSARSHLGDDLESLFKAYGAEEDPQARWKCAKPIIRFAVNHLDQAQDVLLRLLAGKQSSVEAHDILLNHDILLKFMGQCPMMVDVSQIVLSVHQADPLDFDNMRILLADNCSYHMIQFLSLLPDNKEARDYLELNLVPSFAIRHPRLLISNCQKASLRFLQRISKRTEDDERKLAKCYHKYETNPPKALYTGLYEAPCMLFREFLQLCAEKSFTGEIQLLNAFFKYFASLGYKKISYQLYGSCLLKNLELILNNKQHFDHKAILILLSSSDKDCLSQEELDLFRALINKKTLEELPLYFWKSSHILSLLPIIQEICGRIPFLGVLQLKMRSDIPQAEVDKYALNSDWWQKMAKAIVVSQEKKQCNSLGILRLFKDALDPESTVYLRSRLMLKYLVHLKVKEKWEIWDIAKIQDAHLLKFAANLQRDDYKYLIPFCQNPETFFAALQQNLARPLESVPFIRFANRIPKQTVPMKPVEEVIEGLGFSDLEDIESAYGAFEYYFTHPKVLHEIGIYESRYPGQEVSARYSSLVEYAQDILNNYPMKDSDFEKASVGLELLQLRIKSQKI
jgi:hypothetical protein